MAERLGSTFRAVGISALRHPILKTQLGFNRHRIHQTENLVRVSKKIASMSNYPLRVLEGATSDFLDQTEKLKRLRAKQRTLLEKVRAKDPAIKEMEQQAATTLFKRK